MEPNIIQIKQIICSEQIEIRIGGALFFVFFFLSADLSGGSFLALILRNDSRPLAVDRLYGVSVASMSIGEVCMLCYSNLFLRVVW